MLPYLLSWFWEVPTSKWNAMPTSIILKVILYDSTIHVTQAAQSKAQRSWCCGAAICREKLVKIEASSKASSRNAAVANLTSFVANYCLQGTWIQGSKSVQDVLQYRYLVPVTLQWRLHLHRRPTLAIHSQRANTEYCFCHRLRLSVTLSTTVTAQCTSKTGNSQLWSLSKSFSCISIQERANSNGLFMCICHSPAALPASSSPCCRRLAVATQRNLVPISGQLPACLASSAWD